MRSHPDAQMQTKDRLKNLDNFGLKSFSVFDSIMSDGDGSLLITLICFISFDLEVLDKYAIIFPSNNLSVA